MLILRCVHLAELPSPLPGARLVGNCVSCEAPAQSQVQGDTRRNNHSGGGQLSNSGISFCFNYCISQLAGNLDALGMGGADLHSSGPPGGWSVLTILGPLGLRLSQGKCRILDCVPQLPLALGPAPLESCSQGHTAPSSCRAAASLVMQAAPENALATGSSPLGSLACSVWSTLPGVQVPVSVPGSLRASPPLLGSCPSSLGAPFHLGRLEKLLLLQDWASCPGGTHLVGLSGLLSGPLLLVCFFISLFFSVFLP